MVADIKKKFNSRIKARFRKNRQIIGKKIYNLFDWIKGAKLVELKECDTSEDPVRPELDNDFRTGYGRKIYGVKYKVKFMLLCVLHILIRCQPLLKSLKS